MRTREAMIVVILESQVKFCMVRLVQMVGTPWLVIGGRSLGSLPLIRSCFYLYMFLFIGLNVAFVLEDIPCSVLKATTFVR